MKMFSSTVKNTSFTITTYTCPGDFLGKNEKLSKLLPKNLDNLVVNPFEWKRSKPTAAKVMIDIAKNSNDSYHDTPWANLGELKQKMVGIDNTYWKP